MKSLLKQELYKDKWLLIISIPIIVLLIQHVGLSKEVIIAYLKQDYYWYNLCFNLFIISLALLLNKAFILWLDERVPYRPNLKKRILIQIIGSLILLLTMTETVIYLYVKVWAEGDYWEGRFNTDIPITIILIILFNLIYVGLFLQQEVEKIPSDFALEEMPENSAPLQPIEAYIGNKNILLQPKEIALIISKSKIVQAFTIDGKRYLLRQSLKQLSQQLAAEQFFQANRQYIVNRNIIKGYNKLANRKTALILIQDDLCEEAIFISKERSPIFLKWLSA